MLGRLLRPIIGKIFTPLARALLAIGVTADMVTVVGTIITSLLALWLIPNGHLFLGAFLIGIFALFDSLDGVMARLSGRAGPWGAYLDSTLDRITDGAVFGSIIIFFLNRLLNTPYNTIGVFPLPYLPLAQPDVLHSRWWPSFGLELGQPLLTAPTILDFWSLLAALACLILGAIVPYSRARAGAFGLDPKSGFFERATRILFALVPLAFMQFGLPQWVSLATLVVLAVGSLITVLQRITEVKRALPNSQPFADTPSVAPIPSVAAAPLLRGVETTPSVEPVETIGTRSDIPSVEPVETIGIDPHESTPSVSANETVENIGVHHG